MNYQTDPEPQNGYSSLVKGLFANSKKNYYTAQSSLKKNITIFESRHSQNKNSEPKKAVEFTLKKHDFSPTRGKSQRSKFVGFLPFVIDCIRDYRKDPTQAKNAYTLMDKKYPVIFPKPFTEEARFPVRSDEEIFELEQLVKDRLKNNVSHGIDPDGD